MVSTLKCGTLLLIRQGIFVLVLIGGVLRQGNDLKMSVLLSGTAADTSLIHLNTEVDGGEELLSFGEIPTFL